MNKIEAFKMVGGGRSTSGVTIFDRASTAIIHDHSSNQTSMRLPHSRCWLLKQLTFTILA